MPTRFEFGIATPEDDEQLRRRMAEDWMRGEMSVSFRRQPSYFAGCALQGEGFQVIKCTEHATGHIVGMGNRAWRTVFIDGEPRRAGYLADLRGKPGYRNGTLLARGYRLLRSLHEADPIPFYYTLIFDGNRDALNALVGGRAGLPHYKDWGRILTPAIHLDLPKPPIREPGLTFASARPEQMESVFQFVRHWQSAKQLAPVFHAAQLGTPLLRGLRPEDFLLAFHSGRIVACCAAWDQSETRQTHIEAYSPKLALVRPFYNALSRITPLKPLPAPGGVAPYFYLAFTAVEENDPRVFRALLRELYRQRRAGLWHYF
ncbi:MAG: hypothetical protein ABIZ80_07710, partial [Bryobacteraceae bacterium]